MFKIGLLILALATGGFSVHGAEVLRDPKKLKGWYDKPADKEKFVRVATAKIAHLNYELLRRDFPSIEKLSNAEIDAAVLNCVGFISQAQTGNNVVNTPIKLAPVKVTAYRPLGYGRAAVFPCFEGLIDVKGSGARNGIEQSEYKTGLFSLAKALREELIERMTAIIMAFEGYKPGTVQNYGQIDYGFDVILPNGNKIPAGGILRRAHERDNPVGRPESAKGARVEAILRKYGLTSEHTLHEKTWQLITDQNVQMDRYDSLFDFETIYRYRTKFSNSPVNPDPKLELSRSEWDEFNIIQPWAARLAQEIREGRSNGARVEAEMEKFLKPLREKLKCEGLL